MSETDLPLNESGVEVEEVVISEAEFVETKKIRVYDTQGDFFIEVPAGAKVTFGYFNPASAGGSGTGNRYGGNGGFGAETMKTTALRIYEKGDRGNQLACFMGVKGFRDDAIKLTRLVQKVTVERHLLDDESEGLFEQSHRQQREITAVAETDTFQ